jgi:sugar phosphate isomerase/epimerase
MTIATPHPRLSVNAMCTFPWSFDQDLKLWSDMAIRHAGLLAFKLGDDPDADMERLTAANIRASTIITEAFDLALPDTWEATRATHRAVIDLMARHGGHSIYFTPGRTTGDPWRDDVKRLAEAAAPTVSHARAQGVLAAIEPSLRTSVSFVNTLRDAVDVAEETGLALVADFGNMWMERDMRETLARAMPFVALMQIGDVVIGSSRRPAPGGRVHIGDGELPLRRMMNDVLDAGYAGVFDLEVVPADFSAGCDEAALRGGVAAASSLLGELGI